MDGIQSELVMRLLYRLHYGVICREQLSQDKYSINQAKNTPR